MEAQNVAAWQTVGLAQQGLTITPETLKTRVSEIAFHGSVKRCAFFSLPCRHLAVAILAK
jgi:hypothetical protein